MIKKESHLKDSGDQQFSDAEYALYCDSLEDKYKEAKETGLFEILKVLGLDEKHSDTNLVDAVNYYKKKDGAIENDAPINFLSKRDKTMVMKEGVIRPGLYCMLLSSAFAEAIQSKSAFVAGSSKFAFEQS